MEGVTSGTSLVTDDDGQRPERTVEGWIAVGPAEAICAVCCPTEEDVHGRYDPDEVDVVPVLEGAEGRRLLCEVCGRPFGGR